MGRGRELTAKFAKAVMKGTIPIEKEEEKMENIENVELNNVEEQVEAVQEVADNVEKTGISLGKIGLGIAGLAGVGVLGRLVWKRKIKPWIANRKAKKQQAKVADTLEDDIANIELDEIQDIPED